MRTAINFVMMFQFILFYLPLCCFNVYGEEILRAAREIDGSAYCNFEEARKNYNAADLLECIDELAIDLIDRESGKLTTSKDEGNVSTGRQISFMDVFSMIFNNAATSHQSSSLPAGLTSVYQQSNYPAGTVPLSPAFQLNLLDALSTLSRHDDYKCVPRILCEMASGKLPGRSLGKHGSGFFEFLGRNVFTDWLTKIDVAGTSPLLNFGRAMILGYSNRGNSRACYQAFPRCPRDMNGLIYYLNNYNGGFFRLFNRYQSGKYKGNGRIRDQRVGGYSKTEVRERIVGGNLKQHVRVQPILAEPVEPELIRTEPVRNKIQFPVARYQEYFDNERKFPRYEKVIRGGNEIVFPDQGGLNEESVNSIQNDVGEEEEVESNYWQKDNVAFFPRGRDDRRFPRFRFPSSLTLA